MAQVNKTAYYEEPTCTQVFNFNIKNSSTPNMSQFKKPTTYIDQSAKIQSVPKFNIDESEIESHGDTHNVKKDDMSRSEVRLDQHPTTEPQSTAGLSVIMEATREYNRYLYIHLYYLNFYFHFHFFIISKIL